MGYGYVPTQLYPYEEGNRESIPAWPCCFDALKSSQVTTFGAGQESSQVTRQKWKSRMPCLAKAIGPQIVSTTARIKPVWMESVQCDRVLGPGAGMALLMSRCSATGPITRLRQGPSSIGHGAAARKSCHGKGNTVMPRHTQ
ncbi:hypothetical protein CCUS01_02843 [Colletotrichum cuscutae]|uniref:Uncharacterized protein n=1 Tax=Colletotrichum cuscutae TaxID=1209917 RepID=A0AAI9YCL6_9PEZI|nr:hypothetical protein CCUS01_02843 [Colletotrichum cuscutae]